MSTFFRTFQSSLWSHKYFRRLTMDEQFTYIFLLTGEITSDTGLYPCVLEDVCRYTRISLERMEEIFEKFDDCWSEYASCAEEAIFTYAFRLGMQIALDVLI